MKQMRIQMQPELESEMQAQQETRLQQLKPMLAGAAMVGLLALAVWLFGPSVDNVSPQTSQMAASQFAAGIPAALPMIPEQEREAAIMAMALDPEQEKSLRSDVVIGAIEMRWLTLFDFEANDGDIVRVSSGYWSQDVAITNAPQRLAVPVSNGAIRIQGMVDPGGGITIAMMTNLGRLPVPVLAPGQVIDVPVR